MGSSSSSLSSSSSSKVTLKLYVDTKRKRVLCAEASKEAIDFLFNLLGPATRYQNNKGCLANLYQSKGLLHDKDGVGNTNPNPKPNTNTTPLTLYACKRCNNVTADINTRCPGCFEMMSRPVIYDYEVSQPNTTGFVRDIVTTYEVMDDLIIQPMSTISTIPLLKKFNIKDLSVVKEKVVELSKAQGERLLKASLDFNTVLTKVFLG